MHYYSHHIGDYRRDTSALSMIEHGAYRLLMDEYYVSGKPLPLDVVKLCRIVRALSKSERDAVSFILSEFFTAEEDGFHQRRIDAEIAKWNQRGWFPHEGPRLRPPIDEWKATRLRIFSRDNYICRYCGKRGGKLECDHVIPVSRGGSNEDTNLTTACRACNRKKSNKILLS